MALKEWIKIKKQQIGHSFNDRRLDGQSAMSNAFFAVGAICIVFYLIGIACTDAMFSNAVFYPVYNQAFTDFFGSVKTVLGDTNPYSAPYYSIYPALVNLFYEIFDFFIPIDTGVKWQSNLIDFRSYRDIQFGLILYMLIVTIAVYYVANELRVGSKSQKRMFAIVIFTSLPVLWSLMLGNNVILGMVLIGIYLLWMDSENTFKREFSLVLLALAAVLKIYPAIFGVFLLREKRYKDAFKAAGYFFVLFFIPFVFYGGVTSIQAFLYNLTNFSTKISATAQNFQMSWSFAISHLFNLDTNTQLFVSNFFIPLMLFSAVGLSFFFKTRWKLATLCACLISGIPTPSVTYVNCFFIIPLALFLNACDDDKYSTVKKTQKVLDVIYLILFCIICFVIPLSWLIEPDLTSQYHQHNVSFNSLCQCYVVLAMTIILIAEELVTRIIDIKTKYAGKIRIKYFSVLALSSVAIIAVSSVFGVVMEQRATVITFSGVSATNYETVKGTGILLDNGISVSQVFTAQREEIRRIQIRFSTPTATENRMPVILRITNIKNGVVIYQDTLDSNLFANWSASSIYLDNFVSVEQGQQYMLTLTGSQTKEGQNPIAVFHSIDLSDARDGYALINGEKQEYNLAIDVYEHYRTEESKAIGADDFYAEIDQLISASGEDINNTEYLLGVASSYQLSEDFDKIAATQHFNTIDDCFDYIYDSKSSILISTEQIQLTSFGSDMGRTIMAALCANHTLVEQSDNWLLFKYSTDEVVSCREVFLTYGKGFYGEENNENNITFRWCASSGEISVLSPVSRTKTATFRTTIELPNLSGGRNLVMYVNEAEYGYEVPENGKLIINETISLAPGYNSIFLTTNASMLDVTSDERKLVMYTYGTRVIPN